VQFGGKHGVVQALHVGDAVIIPAGVAHKQLGASLNFAVMGAYPAGQTWDMCYCRSAERPQAIQNIAGVPLPKADPIYGSTGPLMSHWKLLD
jgi:uncharacterized protein YjlB